MDNHLNKIEHNKAKPIAWSKVIFDNPKIIGINQFHSKNNGNEINKPTIIEIRIIPPDFNKIFINIIDSFQNITKREVFSSLP